MKSTQLAMFNKLFTRFLVITSLYIFNIQSVSATDLEAPCELYPITLPANDFSELLSGEGLEETYDGMQGNFGYLTWDGNQDAGSLSTSLLYPGNSETYINPDDAADHLIEEGKWVRGAQGVKNSKALRDSLALLIGQEIIIPLWDDSRAATSGSGNTDFHIASFAKIVLTEYRQQSLDTVDKSNTKKHWITYDFLGFTSCGNEPPLADSQNLTTLEDTPLNVVITATDPDEDVLVYSIVDMPINGELSGSGVNYIYSPNDNYNGTDVFTFQAFDGEFFSETASVNITIQAVNDAPTADDQSLTIDEDTPVAVTLSGADIDEDVLDFIVQDGPSNGALSGSGANLTYTPNENYFGQDSFTFVTNDGELDSALATISITINPINDAPIANNQILETLEDTALNITLTASDTESVMLAYTILSQPENGILTGSGYEYVYTPLDGYYGNDSFTFSVTDGELNSNIASIEITVIEQNQAPVIISPAQEVVAENAQYNYQVVATDGDNDVLSYSTLIVPPDLTINSSTGVIDWTPDTKYTQSVPKFNEQCYVVPDDLNSESEVDGVFIASVYERVRAAITSGSDYAAPQTTAWHNRNRCLGCHVQNQTLVGLQASLSKAEVDEQAAEFLLSEILSSQLSDGSIRRSHPEYAQTQTAFALWALTFVPDRERTFYARARALEFFSNRIRRSGTNSYWVYDHPTGWMRIGDSMTAVIVQAANRFLNEAATKESLTVQQQNMVQFYQTEIPRAVTYLVNRYSTSSNNVILSLKLVGLAEGVNQLQEGSLKQQVISAIASIDSVLRSRQNPDGGWQYTGSGSTSDPLTSAWVGLALNFQNPPLSDVVVQNNINYLLESQSANGTWITNSGLFSTPLATTSLVMAYLPVALEFLGSPDVSAQQILYNDTNQIITANVSNRGLADITVPLTIKFYGNSIEANNLLGAVDINGLASSDIKEVEITLSEPLTTDVYVVIEPSEELSECTITNNQSVAAFMSVSVADGRGDFDTQSWLLNVLDVNEAPEITSTPQTELFGGIPYDYTVEVSDPDIGDAYEFELIQAPQGLFINPRSGEITYDSDQIPAGVHVVTIRVTDLRGLTDEQTYNLTVIPNTVPVITSSPPVSEIELDNSFTYDVNATDEDGDVLAYSLRVSPLNMSIDSTTGVITWTPTVQHLGIQNIEVLVSDGRGGEALQIFNLVVFDNQPAVALNQNVVLDEDMSAAITVSAIDPENNSLTYTIVNTTVNGSLTGTGPDYVYTPNSNYNGVDSFTFLVNDGEFDSNIATVSIQVDPVVDAPDFVSEPVSETTIGSVYSYDADAIDPDGEALTYSLSTSANGAIIDSATGQINWGTVDSTYYGNDQNYLNTCVKEIQPSSQLEAKLKWHWSGSTVLSTHKQVMMAPVVIPYDTNSDGLVNSQDDSAIIFSTFVGSNYTTNGVLRAINSRTGEELWTVTEAAYRVIGAASVAAADIDLDGKVDIITSKSGGGHLVFNSDGTYKFTINTSTDRGWGGVSIANIDQSTPQPEILFGNAVYNYLGNLLFRGTGGYQGDNVVPGGVRRGPLSFAADVDLDGELEIIAGGSVYEHDGSLKWRNTSAGDGYSAIANFDEDDFAEVVVVRNAAVYLVDHDGVLLWSRSLPGGGLGGAPTIADTDGDGQPEIGVAGGNNYTVFETDGTVLWSQATDDNSSQSTGSSVFDFQGDGEAEIVYADQQQLRVYNGKTGDVLLQIPNTSGTTYELPVIVDVDSDAQAEIVVISNNYAFPGTTGIRVFEAQDDNWVNTRKIWNQHAYSITNVNDDGSIPAYQEPSWLTHNTFRLNTFLDSKSVFSVADLSPYDLALLQTESTSSLSALVKNRGLVPSAEFTVSFYNGNAISGELLGTVTVNGLDAQSEETVTLEDIPNSSINTDITVVVDEQSSVNECDETNNSTVAALMFVQVTDESNASDSQLFLVNVIDDNIAPVIENQTFTVPEDFTLNFDLDASDSNNDELIYTIVNEPSSGSLSSINNGNINYISNPNFNGIDSFTYFVSDGAVDSIIATVTFTVDAVNDAPVSGTQFYTTLQNESLAMTLFGSDIENDPLTFNIATAPTSGIITGDGPDFVYTPNTDFIGTDTFTYLVNDGVQNSSPGQVTITVVEPVIVTIPDFTGLTQLEAEELLASQGLVLGTVTAQTDPTVPAGTILSSDPEVGTSLPTGSTVNLVVSEGPAQLTIPNVVGNVQANAETTIVSEGFAVGAISQEFSDSIPAGSVISQNPAAGETASEGSAISLVISQGIYVDDMAPEITAFFDREPARYLAGDVVTLNTSITDNIAVTSSSATLDGQPIVLTGSQTVIDTTNMLPATTHIVVVTAIDGEGNSSSETLEFFIADPNDTTFPTVSISSPVADFKILSITDVIGSVFDDNLSHYELALSPAGSDEYTVVNTGTSNVTEGVVGNFDPTMLLNGIWDVRLSATDLNGQTSQVYSRYLVESDLKVGNFSITFEDFNIPVTGIPVSVSRTYDTRRRFESLDFGYGWSVDYQNVRLQENRVQGEGWTIQDSGGFFPTYCVEGSGEHMITVTLPDGRVEEFDLDFATSCQQLAPLQYVTPIYTARPGTFSTLVPQDVGQVFVDSGNQVLLDTTTFEPYNVDKFTLTTVQGFVYELDQNFGITSVTDTNGNSLTFSESGIVHSNGEALNFTRDAEGRITEITAPDMSSIEYIYDANGDLTSMIDQIGLTTQFTYNSTHGLLDIIDPRGVRVSRNEYDDDGRLIATIDADGNRIEYVHNIGANTEQVKDRRGFTTTYVYDNDGNILTETNALGETITRTYDDDHNELTVSDGLGNVTTNTFDGNNNQLSETDPLGNVTIYDYDSSDQLLSLTDAAGNVVVTNVYDSDENLTSLTDALGQESKFAYDSKGQLTQLTDALGQVSTMTYTFKGYKASETDVAGIVTNYTYDDLGRNLSMTTTRTDADGVLQNLVTQFEYDLKGRMIKATDALGNITTTEYNEIDKPILETDANGNQTSHEYDIRGNKTKTIYADASFESWAYDANDNLISQTDRANQTTTMEYDAANRLIKTTYADNTFTMLEYDAAGRQTAVVDARGNRTEYVFDDAGRNTEVKDALGNITTYAYDTRGNRISMTDANGHTTSFTYDDLSRVIETTYHDGSTMSVEYDALGRKISDTDQAGKVTQYAYDERGNLTKVTDALLQETTYTYDEQSNKLTQTDALGRTTTWDYDNLGRVIGRTLPEGQSESMTYDAVGNMLTRTDFNGAVSNYTYNNLNQNVLMSYADGKSVTTEYTIQGLPLTVTDHRGVTQYAYDTRDRLTMMIYPNNQVLEYQYDANGNRTQLDASTGTVNYSFDVLNRLQTVEDGDNLNPNVTTYLYDDVGNRSGVNHANGNETRYIYDSLNRLTNITVSDSLGVVLNSHTYALAPAGQRTSETTVSSIDPGSASGTTRRVDYTYDDLYRLVEEQALDAANSDRTTSYVYDMVGNRLSQTENGVTTTYTYNDTDQLLTEVKGADTTIYTYDINGNTLTKTSPTGVVEYTYDSRDRLLTMNDGVQFLVYDYDASGIRQSKSVDGVKESYLVDTLQNYAQVIATLDNAGNALATYTYGLDRVNQTIGQGVNASTTYYHFDGLGSTRLLSDATGGVTDSYTYKAFGEVENRTGNTVNDYLFTGEQFDANLGFYYLRARYYNPMNGRFHTMDIYQGNNFDPRSLHKYLYTHADPVNNVDPSGYVTASLGGALSTLNILGNTYTVASISFQIISGNYVGAGLEIAEEVVYSKFGGAFGKHVVKMSKQAVGLFYNTFRKAIIGVPRLGRAASSRTLAHNLKVVGIGRPRGSQAHHIVGGSSEIGKRTRALLKSKGVDVNSAGNGVFLPGCGKSKAVGMVHCGRHTDAYEQAVFDKLSGAVDEVDVINRLSDIRNSLLDGTFEVLNKRAL